MPNPVRFIASLMAICCIAPFSFAETQWNQFRGPNGSGIAKNANPPVEFGPEQNVQWKIELPSGHSSPVIWNGKLFITGIHNETFETICINRSNGEIIWKAASPKVKIEPHHSDNSPASSTPFADEDDVYVYFGSYGLLCYDHDGNDVWNHPVKTPMNMHGTATSPIVYKDHVYLIHDSMDGDSYLLAVNKNTGDEVWKAKRNVFNPNWSSPVIWRNGDRDEVVILGGGTLKAYDPATGTELWTLEEFGVPIPVPFVGGGYLYTSTVSGTEAGMNNSPMRWEYYTDYDKNNDGLIQAMEIPEDHTILMDPDQPESKMPARGIIGWMDRNKDEAMSKEEFDQFARLTMMDVRSSIQAITPGEDKPEVAWKYERSIPYMPSSLYLDGYIYMAKGGGVVTCLDAKTGEQIYRKRVGKGNYSASPVAADGRIYISSQEGLVTVFEAGKEPTVLANNELSEKINATPAIVEDTLYLRTETHLYAFSNP